MVSASFVPAIMRVSDETPHAVHQPQRYQIYALMKAGHIQTGPHISYS